MWKGTLGPCGCAGIAGMAVGSQWCSWAVRVYRAVVMMCWICPSRMMWRSVPKSFGRWAVGWTVMWARARWWTFLSRLAPAAVCPLGYVGVGVLVGVVQGVGGCCVPCPCWAGCICLGYLAWCPGTCCP